MTATMASLQTDTMDLSFGDYDCPIMGLLGSDRLPTFESDACNGVDFFAVFEPAPVHTSAMEDLGNDHMILGQDSAEIGSRLEDILGCEMRTAGVRALDGLFDLEALIAEPQAPQVPMECQPRAVDRSADGFSLADFSFTSLKMPCEISAPGSPDSGFFSVQSPCSTLTSDCEPSPCATPAPVATVMPTMVPDLQVTAEGIRYLESLWGNEPVGPEGSRSCRTGPEAFLTTVVLDPCDITKLPIKPTPKKGPTSGKPSKSLTITERKERKRSQNKNAATRYREKKRAEAKVVFEEQSKMEEKNRDLKDKVTLLSREIEYMKELLIEVYRTKGLVE